MQCDFVYCIYQKEEKCSLDQIKINSLGMCEDCLLIHIPEATLETCKKTHRRMISNNKPNQKKPPR